MGTGGPPYTNPLRPRITIKTVDGLQTLYTYDAFNPGASSINIASVDMENAVGEHGAFTAVINDHNNQLPKDNIHYVKVFLELGKTSTSFKYFMIGYADIFQVSRPGTNAQFYVLSGLGSRDWLYKLFINRRERYERNSADAKIHQIVTNAGTKRTWRPLKTSDQSIQSITGMSWAGVSTKVRIPYTTVNKTFVYYGDFLDELADISGAVWFVDYSTGSEILTFKYNPDMMTNIKIKSGDLQDRINDNPNKISYIKSAFNLTDDQSSQAGSATRLFSATIQDNEEMYPLDAVNYAKGNTNLTYKALGQQIIIDNDARRIREIELHLRRRGDPDSPNSRINGGIFMDNNNKPNMTHTLDLFHIDLGSIEQTGTKIRVPIDIPESKLSKPQTKIWVVLFQRSNEEDENGDPDGNGNPNHGQDHTILWAHNNSFNTQQIHDGNIVYSGQAEIGDFDIKSKLSWRVTDKGPMYYVMVFSDIRRIFSRTNSRAMKNSRLREMFIPSDFLKTPQDVSRYLSLNLSNTSKGRRGIADFRVTVPDNFLFRPYQFIGFQDGLSDIDDILRVQRAAYSCTSTGGDDAPIGTLHANLTLSGLYNTLVGACNCV